MSNRAYPEFTLTIGGSDLDRAHCWLADLEKRGEIEIIREGRRWSIGNYKYRHVKIKLISGQLDLLKRFEPDQPALVLGGVGELSSQA